MRSVLLAVLIGMSISIKSTPHDTPEDQVCQVTPASTNVVELNDNKDTEIGLGVYQTTQGKKRMIHLEALRVGYRHIDSAKLYRNEEDVGKAIGTVGCHERTYI